MLVCLNVIYNYFLNVSQMSNLMLVGPTFHGQDMDRFNNEQLNHEIQEKCNTLITMM